MIEFIKSLFNLQDSIIYTPYEDKIREVFIEMDKSGVVVNNEVKEGIIDISAEAAEINPLLIGKRIQVAQRCINLILQSLVMEKVF